MRQIIFLLAIACVASGIALRAVEPMLPQLAEDFGSSAAAASAVITAYALAYAIGQLLYGPLGDRYGKLRVASLALSGAAAASALCALAGNLHSLAALRFATALFAAAPVTLGMAYIGDRVPLERRQAVIARFVTGTIIGQAAGPLAGGVAADIFGWRSTFALIAALFALIGALLWLATRHDWALTATTAKGVSAKPDSPLAVHLALLRLPRVRYVMAAATAETFFFFGAYGFLGAYLQARFRLDPGFTGAILMGVGVGSLMYTLAVTRLLALLGQRGLVTWGGGICCMSYAVAALSPVWVTALPLSLALGFSFYMLQNTLQVKASEMAPQARASGVSLYTSAWSLGQAAGVAAAGLMVSIFGFELTIAAFGLGFFAVGLWLRANLRLLS